MNALSFYIPRGPNLSTMQQLAFSPISIINRLSFSTFVAFGSLIAGASFCFYNLRQANLFRKHSLFCPLNDQLKLVKGRALLNQIAANKNSDEALPTLRDCKTLLDSVKSKSSQSEKNKFIVELVKAYAEKEPNEAMRVAEQLKTYEELFNLANALYEKRHSSAHHLQLPGQLFSMAFTALRENNNSRQKNEIMGFLELTNYLVLAERFHSLGQKDLENSSLEEARALVNESQDPFLKLLRLDKLAISCYEIKATELCTVALAEAKNLLANRSELNLISEFSECIQPYRL